MYMAREREALDRVRAYKFAESIDFENLAKKFDHSINECFSEIFNLAKLFNTQCQTQPIGDHIKGLESTLDLMKSKFIFRMIIS